MKNHNDIARWTASPLGLERKGFSLMELLVCIGILGILTALALPGLAGVITGGVSAKERQQVQCVAHTYGAASAAGAIFPDATREGVIEALTRPGGVRGSGIFADMTFRIALAPEEKTAVLASPMLVVTTAPDGSPEVVCHPHLGR